MAQHLHVSSRKDLYWGILKSKQGKDVEFSELLNAGTTILGDNKLSDAACKQTLGGMRHEACPFSGGTLTVGRTSARLDLLPTVIDEREQDRPVTKSLLGEALWDLLFGLGANGAKYAKSLTSRTSDKIAHLRRSALLTVLIDAGSTTLAVARSFNRLQKVPLRITLGEDDSAKQHLLRLNFISNSIPLLNELSSGVHRHEIGLSVVGGDVRTDRGSVCGLATQVFLDKCATGGDIAIIGTTGYDGVQSGMRCFSCDNLEEAEVKLKFLHRSGFRILIFDSSKLENRPATRVFTELSNQSIDLIVTDDGNDYDNAGNEYKDLVRQFLDGAHASNVSVAVVGM